MADSIQFRRGLRSAVSPLPVAMPGYIEDEQRLIVGNGDGTNAELPNKTDIDNINSQMAEIVTVSITKYRDLALDVGTNSEDWTPALQAANDYISANYSSGILLIPFNIKCNQSFNWDCNKVIIKGNNTKITFTIDNVSTFAIVSTPSITNLRNNCWIEDLKIIGSGQKCNGILLKNDTTPVNKLRFKNITIGDFTTLITNGKNSYIHIFENCDFAHCEYILSVLNETNSGESIRFNNCTLADCTNGILCNNPNADIYLQNCSMDFITNNTFNISNGHIFVTNSHVELRDNLDNYFKVSGNGSLLSIINSKLLFQNQENNNFSPFYCDNNILLGGITLKNCFIDAPNMKTKYLFDGSGKINIENLFLWKYSDRKYLINPKFNILQAGDFENGIPEIFENVDTYDPPTIDTEHYYSGTQSLLLPHTAQARVATKFTIDVSNFNLLILNYFYRFVSDRGDYYYFEIIINWYDYGNKLINSNYDVIHVISQEFIPHNYIFNIPPNAKTATLTIRNGGANISEATELNIDDMEIELI